MEAPDDPREEADGSGERRDDEKKMESGGAGGDRRSAERPGTVPALRES